MIINNILGINLKFCLYTIIAVIIINIKNGKIYFKKSSKIYPIPITRKRTICTKMDIRPFILSPIYSFDVSFSFFYYMFFSNKISIKYSYFS
jgi:hypothetical protein